MSNTLILTLLALALVMYPLYVLRKNKLRMAAFEQLAADMELPFDPDALGMLDRLKGLNLMKVGALNVRNLIFENAGDLRTSIFDLYYNSGGYRGLLTVVAFEPAGINAPAFLLLQQSSFFQKAGSFLHGRKDINFESHPTFSEMFMLSGPREQIIRDFFTPARLTFFETKARHCVEVTSRMIIVYKVDNEIRPESVKDLLTSAREIYGRIVDG